MLTPYPVSTSLKPRSCLKSFSKHSPVSTNAAKDQYVNLHQLFSAHFTQLFHGGKNSPRLQYPPYWFSRTGGRPNGSVAGVLSTDGEKLRHRSLLLATKGNRQIKRRYCVTDNDKIKLLITQLFHGIHRVNKPNGPSLTDARHWTTARAASFSNLGYAVWAAGCSSAEG